MQIGKIEIVILVAVVVVAALLYVNRGCVTCKNRLNAISGPWPGAGSGVMERGGNATTDVSAT